MVERRAFSASGWLMFVVLLAALSVDVVMFLGSMSNVPVDGGEPVITAPAQFAASLVLFVVLSLAASGFTIIHPNHSRAVMLFGRYLGTVRRNGWRWTVPLTKRELVSLRVRNFESESLKVNDAVGNPIEISAVIVWRVVDTAKALFDVDDYEEFVKIQTEMGVRHVASQYPYDSYQDDDVTLRGDADVVVGALQRELQSHLDVAGLEVLDTRPRRLAYAPEIAADMLRRQQASAIVSARQRIVDGAVGMVEMALQQLSERQVIELDDERKAAMVSNLLVVLCGETQAQPVVNTGTLYG